ncbi:hypothetical protein [Hymenobacter jeollabukensis]|uniref:Uncharacterized protein n=1 Tax=Hymenobacter jeollabukensis TaxID=2025313 RepID=A0A5R8WSF8_9BACT|nr:hypothetical protein [Hymenobacter jeollabukensis]TLM94121.1 hypothetical protein FDY95_08865 [Hymenobacter jeollabukensis]
MLTPYDLRSAVGLYHYTRWVQNYVQELRPYLTPEALTSATLLTICECGCAARSQSPAHAHCVAEADLLMAREYFCTVADQELRAALPVSN